MLKETKKTIKIPEGIEVLLDDFIIVKGPKGEIKRRIKEPFLIIEKSDGNVVIKKKEINKNAKRAVNTAAAHIKNMIEGVTKGYVYRLKICSGHFPMNVSVTNNEITIRNFLGEKYPRTKKLKGNVSVKLEKEIITIEAINKEEAGQVAADIEKLTFIRDRDRRRFQDGIYIIEKPE